MDSRPTGYANPIFLVDHLVYLFEVKLMRYDLASLIRQNSGAAFYVSCQRLYHRIDSGFGAQLRRFTGSAIDVQWGIASTEPATDNKSIKVAKMVRVQVTQEDLVHFRKIRT